jgi:hypothetical protein
MENDCVSTPYKAKLTTPISIVPAILIALLISNLGAQTQYNISGMEAFLFYRDKGTFSENIIDNESFILWNVNIGGGSATGRSYETFVKIKVRSTENGCAEGILEVVVSDSERGSVIQKQQFQLGLFELNRENTYPLLIYGTFTALSITAKFIGKGGGSSMTKIIPFGFGE